jgi:hypothetical protein
VTVITQNLQSEVACGWRIDVRPWPNNTAYGRDLQCFHADFPRS